LFLILCAPGAQLWVRIDWSTAVTDFVTETLVGDPTSDDAMMAPHWDAIDAFGKLVGNLLVRNALMACATLHYRISRDEARTILDPLSPSGYNEPESSRQRFLREVLTVQIVLSWFHVFEEFDFDCEEPLLSADLRTQLQEAVKVARSLFLRKVRESA
jgi:hypothetical protein